MLVQYRHSDALRVVTNVAQVIQSLHAIGTIPGVAIVHAAAENGPGTGYIKSGELGCELAWKAPGSSTFGDETCITADGTYILEDGEDEAKYVRVTVTTSYLVGSSQTEAVYLEDIYENDVASDNVDASEAASGDTETHYIYLKNVSGADLVNVKAWMDASLSGIEIAKSGLSPYKTPTAEDHPDVLLWAVMLPNESQQIKIRRTIAASSPADPSVLTLLHFSWDGY